jgi:hypothetical protein
MSANTQPQFTAIGDIASCLVTTALTTNDGSTGTIGTNIFLGFTAGANGSYVEYARVQAVASVQGTSAAATCLRCFISSITSGGCSTSNTFFWAEVALPAIVADSASTAAIPYDIMLGFRLPAGWSLLFSTGTAANANTAWRVTTVGGDY